MRVRDIVAVIVIGVGGMSLHADRAAATDGTAGQGQCKEWKNVNNLWRHQFEENAPICAKCDAAGCHSGEVGDKCHDSHDTCS